jgi:RNA 3'-terminal phosphate cyclase (ATP)
MGSAAMRSPVATMITIDGSQGEGGGQILRTSLALSLITGQPFRMENIRAGRKKPGLLNQHLTGVNAARTIGNADVVGAELGSQTLEFRPGGVTPGDYRFAVGTAGSATLVLQTILPPLLIASSPSAVTLEGGTHNPAAPPFDFLQKCFAPVVERMGPRFELKLHRAGFFPAGGGSFSANIQPAAQLSPVDLLECGNVQSRKARAIICKLSPQIGERELTTVRKELGWDPEECQVESVNSAGPGNALLLEVQAEHATAVFTGFGERGRSAEQVALGAVNAAKGWMAANVPVDEHLADQLLIPFALAGGGSFRTTMPSSHSTTNATIIQIFLGVEIRFEREHEINWRVIVQRK